MAKKKIAENAEQNNRGLTLLGKSRTEYPDTPEKAVIETFDNKYPERDYIITFDCPEFTSLCPVTGQPDFGHITIKYIADKKCVESKALKLYLFSYRNFHSFHEEVVNRVLSDLSK
ncbi:MAG: NADPH-dependent 7-cyano-7-deazaguanine reductase QueF, partial [Lentisphaeria bacterium]|nr:NADPH-dependent 7-cyano-7-deazaguanine reductase QueF [Lentisphaeria bacterium]